MSKIYCPRCGEIKNDVAYEMPDGDYICLDCYSGLADEMEKDYEESTKKI